MNAKKMTNGNSYMDIEGKNDQPKEGKLLNLSRRNSETLQHFNDFLYWREPFEDLDFDELFPLSRKEPDISDSFLNDIAKINETIDMEPSKIEDLHIDKEDTNAVTTETDPSGKTDLKVKVTASKKKQKAIKKASPRLPAINPIIPKTTTEVTNHMHLGKLRI